MAGHSKWANIKHQKAKADAKKGKLFSRISKEVIVAVKLGGPDPGTNARLRLVLQKAKAANMPGENIERNIKKASSAEQGDYDDITYELYGHGGVGIICQAMTDNKNRMASDLRIATNKRGGTIATPGAVLFQFDKKGIIQIAKEGVDPDRLFEEVLEAGAEEFDENESMFVIVTPFDSLYSVKERIEQLGYKCEEATQEMVPKVLVDCNQETREKNLALIEWLEGIDDVDAIFHNMNMEE